METPWWWIRCVLSAWRTVLLREAWCNGVKTDGSNLCTVWSFNMYEWAAVKMFFVLWCQQKDQSTTLYKYTDNGKKLNWAQIFIIHSELSHKCTWLELCSIIFSGLGCKLINHSSLEFHWYSITVLSLKKKWSSPLPLTMTLFFVQMEYTPLPHTHSDFSFSLLPSFPHSPPAFVHT